MNIKLGPYKNWVGPYQIAGMLCFWATPVKDEYGIESQPDWVHTFGEKLADTWLDDICQWIDKKRHRSVKIQIDDYDTWSMDATLAQIIVPMLKQLKETKHGYPSAFCTEDMMHGPQMMFEGEQFTFEEDSGAVEWEAVLDEMIWAFEQVNTDWEEQYYSGEIDHNWIDAVGPSGEEGYSELTKGPNHTFEIDMDGLTKHHERMQKGFDMFGKHYRSLWD